MDGAKGVWGWSLGDMCPKKSSFYKPSLREAAEKKVIFLMAVPLRGGW